MIVTEQNMRNIKLKMTEIRKKNKDNIIQNYYNNCENDSQLWSIFGINTVVFWNDDNGVIRVYFYSNDKEELIELLKSAPKDACLEFLTREETSFDEIAYKAGYKSEFTMKRFTERELSKEEIESNEKYWQAIRKALYVPGLAYLAAQSDLEDIMDKLYDVFNPRESHLCTREELSKYIDQKWVTISRDDSNNLSGLLIFLVEPGFRRYGYQLWCGGGAETLANIQIVSDEAYKDYIRCKEIELGRKIIPKRSYGWINQNNKAAIRTTRKSSSVFDGLYDYGYCKL